MNKVLMGVIGLLIIVAVAMYATKDSAPGLSPPPVKVAPTTVVARAPAATTSNDFARAVGANSPPSNIPSTSLVAYIATTSVPASSAIPATSFAFISSSTSVSVYSALSSSFRTRLTSKTK